MTRIAVIGSCGFVGVHLSIALLLRKHSLLLIDVLPAHPQPQRLKGSFEYLQIDIQDRKKLSEALEAAKIDLLINLSGWGMSTFAMLSTKCWDVNYHGMESILEACRKANISRIIHTSTYNVVFYGQTIIAGDESMPYPPIERHSDEYSKSKCKGEELALSFNDKSLTTGDTMVVSVIRPAAIYGEDEQRHIPRIIEFIDAGIFSMFRVGNALVDWVHVDNLVQAYLLLVDRQLSTVAAEVESVAGQCYFVNDDDPINNFDFLAPLCIARGQPVPWLVIPTPLMLRFAHLLEILHRCNIPVPPLFTRAEVVKVGVTHYFPPHKAQHELGYKPTINSHQGALQLAKRHAKDPVDRYFKTSALIWWVLIFAGMWFLFEVAFLQPVPDEGAIATTVIMSGIRSSIPFYQPVLEAIITVAYLIFRSKLILQWVFYMAVLTHAMEAMYAFTVARWRLKMSMITVMLWTGQTMLLGYPSLTLLLQHEVERERLKNEESE